MEADMKQEISASMNTEVTQADAKKEKRLQKKEKRRRYIGFFYTILLFLAFDTISWLVENLVLDKIGITEEENQLVYLLYEIVHRVLYGVVTVVFVKKLYHRSVPEIFHLNNSRKALCMAAGEFVFLTGLIVVNGVGCDFRYLHALNLTVALLLLEIVLYPLVVGFFEEILFRVFMLDGYFYCKKQSRMNRLVYVIIGTVIFGAVHYTEGEPIRILLAGAGGVAFTTIYLKTRNLVIPMLLHAIHDMYTFYCGSYLVYNWTPKKIEFNNSMHIVLPIVSIVVSLVILLWEKKNVQCIEKNEKNS